MSKKNGAKKLHKMTIHSHHLDTKEEFDLILYLFDIKSILIFFPNNQILLFVNTTYLILSINPFSSHELLVQVVVQKCLGCVE